jgi:hypothetical protein
MVSSEIFVFLQPEAAVEETKSVVGDELFLQARTGQEFKENG